MTEVPVTATVNVAATLRPVSARPARPGAPAQLALAGRGPGTGRWVIAV